MPYDNLASLVGKIQQRIGLVADYYLCVDWLVNSAREIYRERPWTFRRRQGEFSFNAVYSTGTASVERGASVVSFSGATITEAMVGRQLRIGGNETPIRTITRRLSSSPSSVEIDRPWAGAAKTATTFEIYNAYVTVPSDFDAFITIVDPQRQFQINWWELTADSLDAMDPQRSYGGGDQAFAIVLKDFVEEGAGVVGAVVRVSGSGNQPSAGGIYTGLNDAVFTVEMTSASVFQWKKDGGSYTTGVSIDPDGIEQHLQEGVHVTFRTGVSYTSGNVFVIPASAARNQGDPRYEPWPHIKADESRPYLYLARPLDLTDPGAVLHRYIPGDLVLEKALARAASWKNEKNGYYDLRLAALHEARYQKLLADVVLEDEARESTMLTYDRWINLPTYDSAYLQSHDLGYEINVL